MLITSSCLAVVGVVCSIKRHLRVDRLHSAGFLKWSPLTLFTPQTFYSSLCRVGVNVWFSLNDAIQNGCLFILWRKCRKVISSMEPDSEAFYLVVAQWDTYRAGQRFVQGANKCMDGEKTQCEKYQKNNLSNAFNATS